MSEDYQRLAAIRSALGDSYEIMTDANQGFSLDEAIRRAGRLAELDLAWIEEPVRADDHAGCLVVTLKILRLPKVLGRDVFHPHQPRAAFDDSPPERVEQIQATPVLRHVLQHVVALVIAIDQLGLMIERELENDEVAQRLQGAQSLVQQADGGRLLLRAQQPRSPS